MSDITSTDTMRELQGDRVIIMKHGVDGSLYPAYVMTVVRVLDVDSQALRLTNRDCKTRKPDWPMTQAMADALKPAPPNNDCQAKWLMTLKPKPLVKP